MCFAKSEYGDTIEVWERDGSAKSSVVLLVVLSMFVKPRARFNYEVSRLARPEVSPSSIKKQADQTTQTRQAFNSLTESLHFFAFARSFIAQN